MPRVFLSHATPDRPLLEQAVVAPLRQAGVGTWYCKDDIAGMDQWEPAIRQGLKDSDWFLLAMTPAALRSPWVKAELDFAFHLADTDPRRKAWIVPVLLAPCAAIDFHLRLPGIQHFDLTAGA